jgi:uncharacterized protein YutE (UPF0331/DUF86 family)
VVSCHVDPAPIEARLRAIANAVIALRELQQLTHDELVHDHRNFSTTLHDFQAAIQAALDIGAALLAQLPGKAPTDYRSVFTRLGEVGVLPKDFAAELEGMWRAFVTSSFTCISKSTPARSIALCTTTLRISNAS